MKLRDAIEALGAAKAPREPDWFALVLLENVAYLVDDERRAATFERLKREIGITPDALLGAGAIRIADTIADGGMKPMMRAEKVLACAELALTIGVRELEHAIETDPPRAKKLLRRFPSVGEPYADRVLLFCGDVISLAPDSNALRVLTRLGIIDEQPGYAATYRAASRLALRDANEARSAHVTLKRHGREICKRTAPRCDVCALRAKCAWYRSATAAAARS